MQISSQSFSNSSNLKAALIIGLVISFAYSPIIFLDQTYNYDDPISTNLQDDDIKSTIFTTTADFYGDYIALRPNIKLASDLIQDGIFPFWNPHIGVGQPLAADSTLPILSPIMLAYLLPMELWDIPLLIIIWVAGFSTYLFLRQLDLGFVASLSGGILFMLSGAFTWFLPNPNPLVMMFTPLILYSLEKIFRNNNPKFILLSSFVFALAILGEHLETIILQLIFVLIYYLFRVCVILKSNSSHIQDSQNKKISHSKRRVIFWPIISFIIAIGLTAFFSIPSYEFVQLNHLEHDETFGSNAFDSVSLLPSFIPYVLGVLNGYWISNAAGIVGLWGYVGITALFFSILGSLCYIKNKTSPHRFTPVFFLVISFLFLLKIVGAPIISWIGLLPILNLISWTNYLGAIIPLGFVISAAFAINLFEKNLISIKSLLKTEIITLLIIFILFLPLIPFLLTSETHSFVSQNQIFQYVGFQLSLGILFSLFAFLISYSIIKNKLSNLWIIPIISLELSLYVPLGLHPVWFGYKSLLILSSITMLIICMNLFSQKFYGSQISQKIKYLVIILILFGTFIGILFLSEISPYGMMSKHDPYLENPLTTFLENNIDHSRIFSFDYALVPNYSAGFHISNLGIFSAFNIESFFTFNHNFLDPDADLGRLGFPPWSYTYGPNDSISKIHENKKYFDFLGVKYFLSEGYDFNTISYGIPGNSQNSYKFNLGDVLSQNFISPVDSISDIGVSLASDKSNSKILLTINSIPFQEKYYREASLDFIKNQRLNEFNIDPPLTNVKDIQLQFDLQPLTLESDDLFLVFLDDSSKSSYQKNSLGIFSINDENFTKKHIVFSINSIDKQHPVVFEYNDIKITENLDVFPRAFLVYNSISVPIDEGQNFLLRNSDFNFRENVVLESFLNNTPLNLSSMIDQNRKVEFIEDSPNKIILNTKSNFKSILVLTDSFYPGWKVYVDDVESEIFRANGLVRGVFLPEGEHSVKFEFIPDSFIIGITISLVTIVISVSSLIFYRNLQSKISQKI